MLNEHFCLLLDMYCPLYKFIFKTRVSKFRHMTHKGMCNVVFKVGRDTDT